MSEKLSAEIKALITRYEDEDECDFGWLIKSVVAQAEQAVEARMEKETEAALKNRTLALKSDAVYTYNEMVVELSKKKGEAITKAKAEERERCVKVVLRMQVLMCYTEAAVEEIRRGGGE